MPRQNRDGIENIDSYSEEITKTLVQKILQEDEENDQEIEYNETYDDEENEPVKGRAASNKYYEQTYSKKKSNSNYRKNIEKYGKDFFEEEDEEEDYEYYKRSSIFTKVTVAAIMVVLTITTCFLAFSLKSYKLQTLKLKEENQQLIDKTRDVEAKLLEDSLKTKINELEEKNSQLESMVAINKENNPSKVSKEPATEATTTKKPSSTLKQPSNNSNNSNNSEYIVKKNDSFWKISKAIYGNGSYYQKIIDANGLTENSQLKEGQKLIIPKIN